MPENATGNWLSMKYQEVIGNYKEHQETQKAIKKDLYNAYASQWEYSLIGIQSKIEQAQKNNDLIQLQKLENMIVGSYFFDRIKENIQEENELHLNKLKRDIKLDKNEKQKLQKDLADCLRSSLSLTTKRDFLIDYYEKWYFRIEDKDLKQIKLKIKQLQKEDPQNCKIILK